MERSGAAAAEAGVGRQDPVEGWLAERGLAVARVLLSTVAVFLIGGAFPGAAELGGVPGIMLVVYAMYAALLLIAMLRTRALPPRLPMLIQGIDIGFAAGLTLLSRAASGPYITFLLYPIFAAAYRWGFPEVMITAGIIEGLLSIGVLLRPPLSITALLFPAMLVASTGAAAGYLAEHGRRRRFEDRTISLALSRARLGGKLAETVNLVLASVRDAFRASQVLVALQEQPSGRMLVWATGPHAMDETAARPEQLPAGRQNDYFFEMPGAAWHASVRWWDARPGRFSVVAVDERGQRVPAGQVVVPPGFLASHRGRRIVGVTLRFSHEWTGRLYVISPGVGVHREQSARFALRLARQIAPALYDHYLARRLRTHAQTLERRRIARELHDGVTQSLLGLEMEVVVLRRRAADEAPKLAEDLARVHGIVREEVITVRELMEGIRVGDVLSVEMLHHLSDVVDRFSRHTGIATRFVSDGRVADLTPYVRRQIAGIVHEALVNVRKHSGADRVLVSANVDDGQWMLSIEDDGKGFPGFAGRRTLDELETQRQGPRTICERVRIIGGTLTVESRPGFGARVEVAVPVQTT